MKKQIVNSNHYFALGVSGFILAGSIFAFLFVYNQITVQVGNTDTAYNRISEQESQQSQMSQTLQSLSKTEAQRDLLGSFFVNDSGTVNFIDQIEGIGTGLGSTTVSIVSISDDDLTGAPSGTIGNIHTHIDIQGTWPHVMSALHLMESLPYSESINNIRANPVGPKLWNIQFDLTSVLIHQ